MTAAPFTHRAYRDMLRRGVESGYRFSGFSEIDALRDDPGKVCLMRHDCDNDLVAAARLAEIEAGVGVSSTYFVMLRSAMYNLLAPTNARLVRQILGHGHWLGLHFDEALAADEKDDSIAELVDRERRLVSREFGVPIDAASFHQPGDRVLQGRIRLNCVNTYDPRDMAGFHYTSDSNLVFRGGEPTVLFCGAAHPKLQILIHPEWWTEDEMRVAAKWDRMLLNNLQLAEESLRRREAAYTERRPLVLRREGEN